MEEEVRETSFQEQTEFSRLRSGEGPRKREGTVSTSGWLVAKPEGMFKELGLIQFAESSGQGPDENTRATQRDLGSGAELIVRY